MLNTSGKSNYEKSVISLKNCNNLADEFLKGISVNNDEYEMNQSSLIKYYESEIGKTASSKLAVYITHKWLLYTL